MDIGEIAWRGVDWIHMTGPYEHGNEPSGYVKGGEFLG
jgi:hypothetical protein